MRVLDSFLAEGATEEDWSLDGALAFMALALVQIAVGVGKYYVGWLRGEWDMDAWSIGAAVTISSLAFLAITLRRHYPLIFYSVVILSVMAGVIPDPSPAASWLVIILAVYDVARLMRPRLAFGCMWLAIGVIAVAMVNWVFMAKLNLPPNYVAGAEWTKEQIDAVTNVLAAIGLAGVSGAGAIVAAYSIGRRAYDVALARASQEQAEREAAAAAVAEELAQQEKMEARIRASIAREFHDSVAHSVQAMVLQAEGALAQAQRSPAAAQGALRLVADLGREAMQDVRRIVRMLRYNPADGFGSPDEVDLAAAPTLADIPSLVAKSKATLTTTGAAHSVSPGIQLAMYRIIQEALTNSLKHAGPDADPHVLISWEPTQLTIEITNKATAYVGVGDGHGYGLIGMAERVQALDGTLSAQPTKTGGFRVCAKIPL